MWNNYITLHYITLHQMSDKFTVLFDYRKGLGRTRSNKDTTIELGPWLDVWENKQKTFNMRLFYILKPNAENDVIKFGIAGQNSGNFTSWGRLHSYINIHGVAADLNRCKGIRMLYLAGNVYNPKVEVHFLFLFLSTFLSSPSELHTFQIYRTHLPVPVAP